MAKQSGCAHVIQLLALGFTRDEVDRRLEVESWREDHPQVMVTAGAPASFEQTVWAGYLAVKYGEREPGPRQVAVGGFAAATLLLMAPLPRANGTWPIRLLMPFGAWVPDLPGVDIIRVRDWPSRSFCNVRGLRVSARADTLADLAKDLAEGDLLALLQAEVWARSAMLDAVANRRRRGAAGSAALGTAIATLRSGVDSALHQRGLKVLRAAGLPKPECGIEVIPKTGERDCVLRRPGATGKPWGMVLAFDGDVHRTNRAKKVFDRKLAHLLRQHGWALHTFGTPEVDQREDMVAEVMDEWRYLRSLPPEGDPNRR